MVGVEAPTMGPFVSIVYVPLSCMLNWYRTNVMCLYVSIVGSRADPSRSAVQSRAPVGLLQSCYSGPKLIGSRAGVSLPQLSIVSFSKKGTVAVG
jgi:hypothetical protein